MHTVNVGFIGCGTHANMNLYPSLRFADCELVAAADLDEDRRERARRAHGADRVYGDYRAMLDAEDLDAVLISGPPALHHEAALAAMGTGLHVFVEKPPAENLEQAQEMLEVSRQTSRILMVGFMKRFAQKYAMARKIAEREEFGRPTHLLLRYSFNTGPDRRGFLAGMGAHPFDLARYFMGDYRSLHPLWGESADGVVLSLNCTFSNGGTGTMIMNNQAPAVVERLELTGRGTMVVVDDIATLEYYPRAEQRWRAPRKEVHRPNMALQTKENSSLVLQGYAGEVCEFVDAVRDGRPPRTATIEDGVELMRVVELLSGGENGTIEL